MNLFHGVILDRKIFSNVNNNK